MVDLEIVTFLSLIFLGIVFGYIAGRYRKRAAENCHNIVVFSGEAIFKSAKPNNVFYIEELIPAIEQYSDGVLSLNRVQFCVGRLEYMRLELTRETDVEHQAYLTRRYGDCRS